MTAHKPPAFGRPLLWNAWRMVRRLVRQVERRMRYKRLGWV
ncbi:hypothetical protein [Caulobacter sp. S45]|nr:hypothetical protein [Caulobacter sp. S45]